MITESPRIATYGKVLKNILLSAERTAVSASALFEIFINTKYGDSRELRYRTNKKMRELEESWANKDLIKKERQRFSSFMYKLKSDGLLAERKEGGRRLFRATSVGIFKTEAIKKRLLYELPPPRQYKIETSPAATMIIFDIPESQKRKREWLRRTIREFGLSMIQKSVWLGKIKIPIDFIEDLKNLKLLEFVEILQITKTGTLKRLS